MASLFDLHTPPFLHTDYLENLRAGNAFITYESRTSVTARLRNSNVCLMSSFDKEEAEYLLDTLPEDPELFIVVRGPYLKEAAFRRGFRTGHEDCYQFVYASKDPLPEKGILTYGRPEPEDFEAVASSYHLIPPEELYQEMFHGLCFLKGMDREGHFVGFVGLHPEHAMGLLNIFPEYRRRGYAEELYSHLINMQLADGAIPFCQVFTGNSASICLQNKLGFRHAEHALNWMSRFVSPSSEN